MTTEGVDYSRTANADWDALAAALKAEGKHFAGRYAVNDKSPGGRGITGEEYRALMAAGVDVFLYWQSGTDWMLGGYAAGAQGAINAQDNIIEAGMPDDIPVYFACDFDATAGQQAAIDSCLRGAASVLGFERVGLYAGLWPLNRAMANKSARWFCQTSAWSDGRILPGIHLYQYAYNQYVAGTNCDWVRAYQPHYGQASDYLVPAYPKPHLPPFYAEKTADPAPSRFTWDGDVWFPQRMRAEALTDTYSYVLPNIDTPKSGPMILVGSKIAVEWAFEDSRGVLWLVNGNGYHRGSQYTPEVNLPERRTR